MKDLISRNDEEDSKNRIARGLLLGFQIMVKPMIDSPLSNEERREYFMEKQEEINQGLELIPNQLKIRKVIDTDVVWTQDQLPSRGQFLIEWENCDSSAFSDEFNLISKTLLALRLLKPSKVSLKNNYSFTIGSKIIDMWHPVVQLPTPSFYQSITYTLWVEDKEALINIVVKLKATDFNKDSSIRIACDRFNKVYRDIQPEDKLIDLMIAFEALFLTPSRRGSKGPRIGRNCSELIEESKAEKKKIRKHIGRAYLIRNNVLHNSPFDRTEILILLPSLEEYLRKSILARAGEFNN